MGANWVQANGLGGQPGAGTRMAFPIYLYPYIEQSAIFNNYAFNPSTSPSWEYTGNTPYMSGAGQDICLSQRFGRSPYQQWRNESVLDCGQLLRGLRRNPGV